MEKVAIFIDGGYLAKIMEPITGDPAFKLDFGKLSDHLSNGDNRLRTYYYNCPPFVSSRRTPEELLRSTKAHSFYDALNRLPRFQVRLGQLAYRGMADGRPVFVQKRVDALLCVDMVSLALTRQITKAVLLAGDSDFMPAVDVMKQNGVLVELWHGPKDDTVHDELWRACDDRVEIDRACLDLIRFTPPARS